MSRVQQAGDRIEALLAQLRAGGGPAAEAAEELTGALVGLYGDCLSRVAAALAGDGPAGAAILGQLADDPLVGSLLLLHDLHPLDTGTRIQRALDRVRPYLGSHAGGVEYLGVTGGVARLRLAGSCHGCPSSTVTVRLAIEEAVTEAAPEVSEVVVEGVTAPPEPELLQIGPRPPGPAEVGAAGRQGDWVTGPAGASPAAARPMPSPAAARPMPSPAAARRRPEEACEMCGAEILATHGHVADLERSSLLCTCRPCHLLFTHGQAGGGRYRAVPGRYLRSPRPMTAAEWEELQIPVGLAFFLRSSADGRLAGFYPSPAGVTECQLDLGSWERIAAVHPLLGAAEADVEAVLIHRSGDQAEHFVVPIDACYELAGRLRLQWQGFDGGAEARQSITDFLDQIRSRAGVLASEPGA